MVANAYGQNSGIGTDGYVIAYLSGLPQLFAALCRATFAEEVIDEHDAMTDEAVIAHGHQLTDEAMGLYFASLPYAYVLLYLYKGTNEGIVAYGATIKVDRLYHGDVLPEGDVFDSDLTGLVQGLTGYYK